MSIIANIISIYRIKEWSHYLGFVILGLIINLDDLYYIGFLKLTLLYSFLLSYAYSYNDYYDLNQKKHYFIFPLSGSFLMFLFLDKTQVILASAFILITTLYSYEKTNFKSLPIVGTISNTIGYIIPFLAAYLYHNPLNDIAIYFVIVFGFYNTIAQLIHEKVHFKRDISSRKTTVILFDKHIVKILKSLLIILFTVSLFGLLKTDFKIFSISSMIFSIYIILNLDDINQNFRKKFKILGVLVGLILLIKTLLIHFIL